MRTLAILAIVATLPFALARRPPVLLLNCIAYPDVCDTHCYAVACGSSRVNLPFRDVERFLHYAPQSDSNYPNPKAPSVSESKYRRQANGCANSDCKDRGFECDEFPYASTYDGGLGCIKNRYHGSDQLAQTGLQHCATPSENLAHGTALRSFYSSSGLANGERFQVGFDSANVDNAPGCRAIRQTGKAACSALAKTGAFLSNGKTATTKSFCPARGQMGRRGREGLEFAPEVAQRSDAFLDPHEEGWHGNVTFHPAADAHGNDLLFLFGGRAPEPGSKVYRVRDDGEVHESEIL